MSLKVIKHEQIKNRIIVTVEVSSWWGLRKRQKQFIDSDDEYQLISEDVWYTYPAFIPVSWHSEGKKYHQFLNGWKRFHLLHLNT